MTTIRTVTQAEMKSKFSTLANNILNSELNESHIAIVSDRTPSKISVIESTDFLTVLKERGFSIPQSMEDVAVVSVVSNSNKNTTTTGKKMKR